MRHLREWVLLAALLAGAGCSPASRSPDAIRQDSAAVTAAAVRDGKAVVKGVFDGLKTKGPLNLNKASVEELQRLPGIDAPAARRIVAARPYRSGAELMKRHVVTKAQYERIASQVVAR